MTLKIIRTEQIWLKPDDILSELCHYSKNLWNEANYIIRQEFLKTDKWLRYNTLAGALKTLDNFRALPAATVQQVLKTLDRSWNSFFKAINEWPRYPGKFLGMPKLQAIGKRTGSL